MPPLTPSPLDALIPIIITLFKQTGFPSRYNAWLAIAIYVVWTGVSLYTGLRVVEGPVTPEVFISSFVTAASTGFISYSLFWKHLPGDAEARLELATSVVKGPESDPVDTGEDTSDVSDGETLPANG